MHRIPFVRSLIAASIAATLAACNPVSPVSAAPATSSALATPAASAVAGRASAVDFSEIVERYGPAVVNVSVTGKAPRGPQDAASEEALRE
ncbi:MAG: peptidase, partial [Burkholderiales bacterium]|nr:peptidase [Burkholderiales bacterium]